MHSNPRSICDLFDGKHRYIVPLFQRQYVWSREKQWEPLWLDISNKAIARLEDEPATSHFLGAMVLDQIRTFGNQVPSHIIIDGQQRLTTFQLFLVAFRDFAKEHGHTTYSEEINRYILNTGLMENPETEQFKVWPARADQEQFSNVITAYSLESLEKIYPRQYNKKVLQPRPQMIEAYLFFYKMLDEFVNSATSEEDKNRRVEAIYQSLKNDLQIISIELEGNDDAQVIFETLNARGEPLLPSDLLRNFIFLRVGDRKKQDKHYKHLQDKLYKDYWEQFDTKFWRKEEKQGRLKRARVDLFMHHFLSLKKTSDINFGRMFHEYKSWISQQKPYASIEDELSDMVRYAQIYRSLLAPDAKSKQGRFAEYLQILDIRTIYPLLLYILVDADIPTIVIDGIIADLESYIIRRTICEKTTKNYNKLFLQLVRECQNIVVSRSSFQNLLLRLSGDAGVWPDDTNFEDAWINTQVYEKLGPQKVGLILAALEAEQHTHFSEDITIHSKLSIEHVMPKSWEKNWHLKDGTFAKSWLERWKTGEGKEEGDERNQYIHTFGNLTLLTQPFNASLTNSAFDIKRPKITAQSTLLLNNYFQSVEKWDVESIKMRGHELFEVAKKLWAFPSS